MRVFIILLLTASTICQAQNLDRRASWQATFSVLSPAPGVKLESIEKNSPLSKEGLQPGDIILGVNGQSILTSEDWSAITYGLRAGQETVISYRRNHKVTYRNIHFDPIPRESHETLDTHYEEIISDAGIRQRTIITIPKERPDKLPAMIMLQGLSCSSIEVYPGRSGNWPRHINYLVENSDMVVMRVEKPGVGDSDGDCGATDFHTELEGYRAAIRELKAKAYVDTTRIIVYGSSMGSALAPLLANEFRLAAVISDGTFFKTWFEHMLEIERRIRQMNGDSESIIVKKMNEGFIPLYYGMLIEGKTYEEVIKENPSLSDYNYHGPAHMYGRPVEYYQQLQQMDLAGEWQKLQAPLRILYGSNDWIMSKFDNEMIMNVLDAAGHKNHELLIYPGLDHWNTIHESAANSFFGKPGRWEPKVPQQIVDWAQDFTK